MVDTILAIDYGLERVGLAISPEGAPQRLQTLPNDSQLLAQLAEIVASHHVDMVLVGLPRTSDGTDTAWTAEVRRFADNLSKLLAVAVILRDEFGTTSEARTRLDSQKINWKQQREVVDQEAAMIILEDYLHAL